MTYFLSLDHDAMMNNMLSLIHTSGGKMITGNVNMQYSDDTVENTICFIYTSSKDANYQKEA